MPGQRVHHLKLSVTELPYEHEGLSPVAEQMVGRSAEETRLFSVDLEGDKESIAITLMAVANRLSPRTKVRFGPDLMEQVQEHIQRGPQTSSNG